MKGRLAFLRAIGMFNLRDHSDGKSQLGIIALWPGAIWVFTVREIGAGNSRSEDKMRPRRGKPYIWVTWITGIMAGEAHCEWAGWIRAHFQELNKRPQDVKLAGWKAEHGEMVRARAERLRNSGWTVYIEDQNKFSMIGHAAQLGGTPDIVATKDDEPASPLVIDCKTGKQRERDLFQVFIYMAVLPYTHLACIGKELAGEVQYKEGSIPISRDQLTDEIRKLMKAVIQRIAGSEPPAKVPSANECGFCDIDRSDCPERFESTEPAPVQTAMF